MYYWSLANTFLGLYYFATCVLQMQSIRYLQVVQSLCSKRSIASDCLIIMLDPDSDCPHHDAQKQIPFIFLIALLPETLGETGWAYGSSAHEGHSLPFFGQ